MESKIHYRGGLSRGRYACGVGKRWDSQDISSTFNEESVTCKSCRRIVEIKKAQLPRISHHKVTLGPDPDA